MSKKFESTLARCPYCKERKKGHERYCFRCKLDYADLEGTRVKDAVNYKKGGKIFDTYEGEIVYSPVLPDDISISTLKILTIFFGFFGLQNFYTGRFGRGVMVFTFAVLAITSFVFMLYFPDVISNVNLAAFYFGAITLGFWVYDIFGVAGRKFKFPVLLKTPVDVDRIFDINNKGETKRR